jgi:predicted outer membrane protein
MKGIVAITALAAAIAFSSGGLALAQNAPNSGNPNLAPTNLNNPQSPPPTKNKLSHNQKQEISQLLKRASEMNAKEQAMAKLAKSKAGNNAPFATLAETVESDHAINQQAIDALAKRDGISLSSPPPSNQAKMNKMKNMPRAEFERTYLDHQIKNHQKAIGEFREAEHKYSHDHAAETYIGETIPMLQAHLHMSENLRHSMKAGAEKTALNAGRYEGAAAGINGQNPGALGSMGRRLTRTK